MEALHRVLDDFPYPVAYPYRIVFHENERPSIRRWALCFTQYQLLRTVCLPLVGQFLREEIHEDAHKSIASLNRAIAAIRSPFFSDWITLVHTLRRHLPKVGIKPVFPKLGDGLGCLKEAVERPVGLRASHRLNALDAILALRNGTAHGGIPDEGEARGHLDAYLPVLHHVLRAFDFLGDTTLLVCCDGPEAVAGGRARVQELLGAELAEPVEKELSDELVDAFEESSAVMISPDGNPVPLYPLFHPVTREEPLYLYDGHYGIRVQTKQRVEERSYIYYLGVHHRAEHIRSCERLKGLLARRQISFFLSKTDTAPWTIVDSATDYSRRTLEELIGTKYFPACYVPFEDVDRHVEVFLRVPDPQHWPGDTQRPRYANGLVLVGLAGAGKTVLLARWVERLLEATGDEAGRENPNLVLFLRGNGIALRPEGMSLFRDLAEKLGIAAEGSTAGTGSKSIAGFSGFRELLDHLHARWKEDRVPGRRLILVLDALNEAPFAEKVTAEGLEMIAAAACYPWCKIVISTRQEWLGIWSSKLGAQEASRLEELRPCLYFVEPADAPALQPGPPVVTLDPFTSEQARKVYGRYQVAARDPQNGDRRGRMPACRTAWDELPRGNRDLLTNPLYLHLFMEAFDGRAADRIKTVGALFRRYVDRSVAERPGLGPCVRAVVDHLLGDLNRAGADLTDDDCSAIRRAWVGSLSSEESRLLLSPVEGLAHEGLLLKRVREEGGGYRFVFQAVAEYLIYRHLAVSRPEGEEPQSYWVRCAGPSKVFPEYARAFGFLFSDWSAAGRLGEVGPLMEASAEWLGNVLTTFLIEQARTGYVPGAGSAAAEITARALSGRGGRRSAGALSDAGYQLMRSPFALAASDYCQTGAAIYESLWAANPENVSIGNGLGRALVNLGNLLRVSGRVSAAESAYRRSAEMYESLLAANPEHVAIGDGLGCALDNLGSLLRASGRVSESESAYRRSVEMYESLWAANPENVAISDGLGRALNNLANLLRDAGRESESECAYRRSVEMYESLWAANPENVSIGDGLGRALNNLANSLRDAGRESESEWAYRRSVEMYESLWAANPENVSIGNGLGCVLDNLGNLLRASGRVSESESAYRRSVEMYESLRAANPENVSIGDGLGCALGNLGNLLRASDRVSESESAYRRSVEMYESLRAANPENVSIGDGLGCALDNLGNLLSASGRVSESESAYRRSVEMYESLWAANPENVSIGDGLGCALGNLGSLLSASGRVSESESAYRRSVEISESLWAANPDNVSIGNGLGIALGNLGRLLRASGRVSAAGSAYRRSVEIFESLWAANPDHVEIKAGYAGSLCSAGRLDEAERLVAEVLEQVPQDPYASQLKRYIEARKNEGK